MNKSLGFVADIHFLIQCMLAMYALDGLRFTKLREAASSGDAAGGSHCYRSYRGNHDRKSRPNVKTIP